MTNGTPHLPYLVLLRGQKPFQVFNLTKDVITIGRAADNDIVLMDRRISRHHARLIYQEGKWVIEDLGSDNGVWVNGVRVSRPAVVSDDNIISLGQAVQFEMELKPDVPEGVAPRKMLPRWMLPAGILGIGGLVALGVLIVAVIGYFLFFPPGGKPLVSVDMGGTENVATPDIQNMETAIAEGLVTSGGPRVTFQEPMPGTIIPLNGSFMVNVTANDEDGVVRIDLWVDDQLAITQTSPDMNGMNPFILTHGMQGTELGTYALVARAYDSGGAMGESAAIYITVSDKVEAPPVDVVNHVVQPDETTLDLVAMHTTVDINDLQVANPGVFGVLDPGQNIALPNKPGNQQNPPPPAAGGINGLNPFRPGVAGVLVAPELQVKPFNGIILKDLLPDPNKNPPQTKMQAPTWELVGITNCEVRLSWKVNSTDERGIGVYRRQQPQETKAKLIKVLPPKTSSYVDKVFPGTYEYVIEAMGEPKISGNAIVMDSARSKPYTAKVSTGDNCFDDPDKVRFFYFQPWSFASREPGTQRASLWYSILGGTTSRKIPPQQGLFLTIGAWDKNIKPEAQPVPPSILMNEEQEFFVSTYAHGETLDTIKNNKPPVDLGKGFISVTPKFVLDNPNHVYYLTGTKYDLDFKMWFDDMKWTGKGWSSNPAANKQIPAPRNLKYEPDRNNWYAKLSWEWSGDADSMEGFIIYRSYNCGGDDKTVMYPETITINAKPDNKYSIPLVMSDEPAGCLYRYQVSAYGRYGESALSNAVTGMTASGYSKVTITFLELKTDNLYKDYLTLPAELTFKANQHSRVGTDVVRNGKYTLNKMELNGRIPNNTIEQEMAENRDIYILYSIYTLSKLKGLLVCEGVFNIPPSEWKDAVNKTLTHTSLGGCTITYTINSSPVEQLPSGTFATKVADMAVEDVARIGMKIYAKINNNGPDNLVTEPYYLTSIWNEVCDNGKLTSRTFDNTEKRYVGTTIPQWVYLGKELDDFFADSLTQKGRDSVAKDCHLELFVSASTRWALGQPDMYQDPNPKNNRLDIELDKIKPMK